MRDVETMSEPLLTPQEVAKLLRISVKTVYENKERFGPVYPGGLRCLRFKREAVDAAMGVSQRPVAGRVKGPDGGGQKTARSGADVIARAREHGLLRGRR